MEDSDIATYYMYLALLEHGNFSAQCFAYTVLVESFIPVVSIVKHFYYFIMYCDPVFVLRIEQIFFH